MSHIEINTIPGLLAHIPDPPKKLFAEGNIHLLSQKDMLYVCIVGPRKASSYGTEVAELILRHLQKLNVITVSGAAYGIDSVVHKISLNLGIPTISVPGSGIDDEVFYPRAHLDLKHQILEAGGLIVNEFEPLVRAAPWTFPVRNRLMAGMSHLTIVVEAEKKSGTLITAHLATDFGREVIAVPGSIHSTTSRGTHELISKGATILVGLDTITEILKSIADRDGIELYKKEYVEVENVVLVNQNKSSVESLSFDERKVYECIKSYAGGVTKFDICRLLDMTVSQVSIYVTLLELHGLISYSMGKVRTHIHI